MGFRVSLVWFASCLPTVYAQVISALHPPAFHLYNGKTEGTFVQVLGIQKDNSTGRRGASMHIVFSSLCLRFNCFAVISPVCKIVPSPRQRILRRQGIYLLPLSFSRTQRTASRKVSVHCMFVCF